MSPYQAVPTIEGSKMPTSVMVDPYQTLSEILDFPDKEQRYWWDSTAPMFSKILRNNQYSIHDQYKFLGLYKKYVVPFLGNYPTNNKPRWLSILTRYGAPFELSVNCSQSLVRFAFEPINATTGTAKDPFNTHAVWQVLEKLSGLSGGFNFEGVKHFKRDLTLDLLDSAQIDEQSLRFGTIKTQNLLAFDLDGGTFQPKIYLYPALKSIATGISVERLITDSVRSLPQACPLIPSLCLLEDYLRTREPNSTASVRLFSCDVKDPAKSRIKIYVLEEMVSAQTIEDLWTLGRRRKDTATQDGLSSLLELWNLLQIPSGLRGYPEPYLPLGSIPDEELPLMANFTLQPDGLAPEPQIYLPTFGMKDRDVAHALTTFFNRNGWTQMAQTYESNIRSYL